MVDPGQDLPVERSYIEGISRGTVDAVGQRVDAPVELQRHIDENLRGFISLPCGFAPVFHGFSVQTAKPPTPAATVWNTNQESSFQIAGSGVGVPRGGQIDRSGQHDLWAVWLPHTVQLCVHPPVRDPI